MISSSRIIDFFEKAKKSLQAKNKDIFFDWSTYTIEDIVATASNKLQNETDIIILASHYAFWIARLKPCYNITPRAFINEYLGIAFGITFIKEELSIQIDLTSSEFANICKSLRYHNISPHALSLIFALWLERAK